MSIDWSELIYLNPGPARSHGIRDVDAMKAFWDTVATEAQRQNFETTAPEDARSLRATSFFAFNTRSSDLDVVGLDAEIRGPDLPASSNTVYVPNLALMVVVRGSNEMVAYDAPQHVESLHVAPGYPARIMYASGRTRDATVQEVSRVGPDLFLRTRENDITVDVNAMSFDAVNNAVIQGVYVSDARRLMLVASARDHGSNLRYLPDRLARFNAPLYKLLYPHARGMSLDDCLSDYLGHSATRIGSTEDIAAVSVDMRQTVPALDVSGTLTATHLSVGSTAVSGISRDFQTDHRFCSDDTLITERAIKTYCDRARHATFLSARAEVVAADHVQAARIDVEVAALRSATVGAFAASNVVVAEGFSSTGAAEFSEGGSVAVRCPAVFEDTVAAGSVTASDLRVSRASASELDASNLRAASGVFSDELWALAVSGREMFAESASISNCVAAATVTSRLSVSGNADFAGPVSADDLAVSRLYATAASADALDARDARFEALAANSVAADRVEGRRLVASNAELLTVSAGDLSCDSARADVLEVTGGAIVAQLAARSISVEDACTVNVAQVTGRLDVTGSFSFPDSTYIRTSNVQAQSLAVTGSAAVAGGVFVDGEVRTRRISLVRRRPAAAPRQSGSAPPADELAQCLAVLRGLDPDRVGRDSDYDKVCLRSCMRALKLALQNG